jgi:hypothetical protein
MGFGIDDESFEQLDSKMLSMSSYQTWLLLLF